MKFHKYDVASISLALFLSAQCANAQENSVENFALASLKVEKAHVIEGIYYLTQVLSRHCHSVLIDKAALEFANNNREFIERVNSSLLLPMVRDAIEKANAAPKPPMQMDSECAQTSAALRTFGSDPGM
jgi:hypothetical protein